MKRIINLFLISIIASAIFAQNNGGITPWDIAGLKYAPSAIINNAGTIIAYTITEPADPTKENKPSSSKLYLYDVQTEESSPFVTQGSVWAYKFRPGHESITFLNKRDKDSKTALYEISLNGGEAQKIFEYSNSISYYNWSSDGNKLAFISKDSKEKSKSPYEAEIYEENLIYSRAYTKDLTKEDPAKEVTIDGNFYSIKWSPDGKKLASAIAPTPLIDHKYMDQKIHIYNSADFSPISTVDHAGKLSYFNWSPNGKEIAFIAGTDINDPTAGRLFVADAKTGKAINMVPDFNGKFEVFEWTDNENLQILLSEGVYTTFAKINTKTKAIEKIIDKGSVAIIDFDIADNGNVSFIGSTANYPYELHLLKKGETKLNRITKTNPEIEAKKFGKQEVISYKAKDGLEIQGILIHPVNEEKGKKYPLITLVHGGPESHFLNGWMTYYSRPGQMAAAEGYVVFYPNYRGSTGYGEKFAKSSQADPAGLEFEDVLDGIDYLIETGLVDKDRVGVTGGSYGGYATAWFSTKYSDRFAAGVMFVGISNTISGWGNSDIPTEHFHVHYLKHIWEDFDFFWERSPVKHVGNAKTPLLICAGKGDTRVDPGQSLELYRHIKMRTETPVRLVFYPGEGHGNRKATARYDYNLRMMRWFDTFLMNAGTEMPDNKLEELK